MTDEEFDPQYAEWCADLRAKILAAREKGEPVALTSNEAADLGNLLLVAPAWKSDRDEYWKLRDIFVDADFRYDRKNPSATLRELGKHGRAPTEASGVDRRPPAFREPMGTMRGVLSVSRSPGPHPHRHELRTIALAGCRKQRPQTIATALTRMRLRLHTPHAAPKKCCCIRPYASTSRRFSHEPVMAITRCRTSWNASFAPTSNAESWPTAFFACTAMTADSTVSYHSPARAGSVRPVVEDACPTPPHTWWIECFPKSLCDSGS